MKLNKPTYLILFSTAALATLFALLWSQSMSNVSADAPRIAPAFEGEPFSDTLNHPDLLAKEPIRLAAGSGLTTVFSDTFETGLDQTNWESLDANGVNFGDYKWDAEMYAPAASSGSVSIWAVGGGLQGSALDPTVDGYPDNVDSWLILGPIDMSDIAEASITFTYWLQSDSGDNFGVSVSTDGSSYNGLETVSGGTGGFTTRTLGLNSYAGETTVYIAFTFHSDAVVNAGKKGVFLDDVSIAAKELDRQYLPIIIDDFTPTPLPTPTSTPPPSGGNYQDDFNNSGSGWVMRRTDISGSNNWNIEYRNESPQSLQMSIETANEYLLASPLVAAPSLPYYVETRAKFYDTHDRHAIGLIFGGDWNGTNCPNGSWNSCFNRFYWLIMRYRENNGNPKIEMELRYVTSFNSSNQPVYDTVMSWIAPADFPNVAINPDDWTSWKVELRTDNSIKIFANGNEVTAKTHSSLSSNLSGRPFFGLMSSVSDAGDSRQRFDLFKVHQIQ